MRASIRYLGITVFLLSGCSLYRVSVQQGEMLSNTQKNQIQVGMNKDQVEYVLGEPLMRDDFSPNRWDYVYFFKNSRGKVQQSKALSVFFNEQNKVSRIEEQ